MLARIPRSNPPEKVTRSGIELSVAFLDETNEEASSVFQWARNEAAKKSRL